MKKVLLLATVLFISSTNSQSQDNDRKGFFSPNLGLSIPVGNFGSTNFGNNEAGYATSGFVFDITFCHKIFKNFGVTGIYRSQGNGADVGAYAQDLANYFGASNPAGNTIVSLKSSAYSLGGIMAGLNGSFPIVDKLTFEPRVLGGFSGAILPATTTKAYESNTLLTTFVRAQSSTLAFSYIIGAGLKYDASKKICLLFNIDFYAARAEWDNVQEIGIGHISGETEINYYDFSQKFSTVNLSTGLGFRF
jgi:hypothetical protein